MCGSWLVCFLLTVFDVLPSKSDEYGFAARTDISMDAVTNSPWIHVPYPGKWEELPKPNVEALREDFHLAVNNQ